MQVLQPVIRDRFRCLMRVPTNHRDLGSPCRQASLCFLVKHGFLAKDQRGGYTSGGRLDRALQPSLITGLAYAFRYEVERLSVDRAQELAAAIFPRRQDSWKSSGER